MSRLVTSVLLSLVLGAAFSPAPAMAGPPERIADPFAFVAPDLENGLVIFVNTSHASFCTPEQVEREQAILDWLEEGMVDPFPEEALERPDGFAPVPALLRTTPTGVVATTRGTVQDLHMELWTLDAPDDDPGIGPCLGTDDSGQLFASGTSTFTGVGTDFDGWGRRPTAIDKTRGAGEVTTPEGARFHYSWSFLQHFPCLEHGPKCEIAQFQLRPLQP